jgi:hypothetical protein
VKTAGFAKVHQERKKFAFALIYSGFSCEAELYQSLLKRLEL